MGHDASVLHYDMKRRAFTLIELLTAISVIAIVMALTSPAVLSAIHQSRVQSNRERCRQIAMAMGHYVEAEGDFVPSVSGYGGDLTRALAPSLGPRWYWETGEQRGWSYRMETHGTGHRRTFTITATPKRGAVVGYVVDRAGNVEILHARDSQPWGGTVGGR